MLLTGLIFLPQMMRNIVVGLIMPMLQEETEASARLREFAIPRSQTAVQERLA
jgi:hypothetical protein